MAQKVITIVLGLAVVAAMGWYVNKNYIQPTSSSADVKITDKDAAKPDESTNTAASKDESLVYVVRDAATVIWSKSGTAAAKKAFTDADETDKISLLSNVAASANKVFAVTSADSKTQGTLVAIGLSSAKSTRVRTGFAVPENLAVSADAATFCYTRFSNVEVNYGFTLYYEQSENGTPTQAANAASEIISPAFSPSGQKIAYAVTSGKNTELFSYSISNKKADKIATLEGKVIDSISWPSADKIIISSRKTGNETAGEISAVSPNNGKVQSIADFSGGRASFAYIDSAGGKLAFIVAQYKDKVETNISGQIFIVDLASAKKDSLEKGNQILGWSSS